MNTMLHFSIVIFYLLVYVFAEVLYRGSIHQPVYVNFNKGTDDSSCGPSAQPCKHLATAVKKSTDEVIIVGTITLKSPVTISRNIAIRTQQHDQPATVEGEGMSKQPTFKLAKGKDLTIRGIQLINIRIAELSDNSKVTIDNCSVTGNVDKVFRFVGQHSTLNVTNTIFTNINGSVINETNGTDVFGETGNQKHAVISFIGCRFHNISCCAVCNKKLTDSLTFIRCSFVDVAYSASEYCTPVSVMFTYSPVYVFNCTFTYTPQRKTNSYIIDGYKVASLNITRSHFKNLVSKASSAVGVSGARTVALHYNTFNNIRAWKNIVEAHGSWVTSVVLHNNRFNNNKAGFGIVGLAVRGSNTISIDNCSFTNNVCDEEPVVYIAPGYLAVLPIIPVTTITNTCFNNNTAQRLAHNIYSIGQLTLRNVKVISSGISSSLNQIVSKVGKFSAENVLIKIQRTHVTTENNGMLVLSPEIKRLSKVSFYCPVNFNADLDLNFESATSVFNSLSMKCESCTKGAYSLENGQLKLPELTATNNAHVEKYNKDVNEYIKKAKIKCFECPVGGTCEERGLKASPNFWGFAKSNHVSFVPCPIGYCCISEGTQCRSYNTCNKGREGNICGRCKKGYRLNFFNDTCVRKNDKCDNILFATYSTIYSFSITLFFAYVANITDVLKRAWIRLKRKMRCFDAGKRVWIRLQKTMRCFDNDDSLIPEDQDSDTISQNRKPEKSSKQTPKLAVFHLMVFYYQLANLLHVKVEKQNTKNMSLEGIKSKITNFVYLRFTLHIHEQVCLTTEINFLGKTGINLLFKLSTITNLFLFFIIWKLVLILKKKTIISFWLQRLVPTRGVFQCQRVSCISWLRRNIWIPLVVRRIHVLNVTQIDAEDHGEGNQHSGEDQIEPVQEFTQETHEVSEEQHEKLQGEDRMPVDDQDEEPTHSRYLEQENQHVREQENEQSNTQDLEHQYQHPQENDEQGPTHHEKSTQTKVQFERRDKQQNRKGRKCDNNERRRTNAIELDIQPSSESDSDPDASIEDEQDQFLIISNTDDDQMQPMPFPIRLKSTLIKLLKTIYTPITEICFQLVFCISINGVKHLYLYGDLVCFTWWQNLIMILVIPGLILFPLTFGMSLHLIQTRKITSNKFLIAAGVPYFAIYLYLNKRIVGVATPEYSVEDEIFANEILRSYKEVFRQHNQLISWPVVQLYRNFVIAAVKTFIIDPMYRSLTFLPVFCLFFVHDRSAKPFLNKSVNMLQTSSTVCLTMIVICNMIFSFSLYMPNIDTIPHMNTVLTVLSYVESIVYFIFPLMLPISIVWRNYMMKEKEE